MDTSLPRAWLEDQSFDLVGWYHQHLDLCELYEQKYYEAYRERYLQSDINPRREEHSCYSPHGVQACPESEWDDLPELEDWPTDESEEANHPGRNESVEETVPNDLPGLESLSDESEDEGDDPDEYEGPWGQPDNPSENDEVLFEQM